MSGNINMTEKKGYTLIELLIVIALFSIVFAIALPNMSLFKAMREKQEINEFRKDLLFARNSAIVENRSYSVYFYIDRNTYSIKESERDIAIKTKTFSNGLKLNEDDIVGSFTFTPSGATGNSGTVYIDTIRNSRYKITLTPATGRIEVKLENK